MSGSMPCYHPLHAFKGKCKEDASKTVIVFNRVDSWRGERIDLPCGQCVGCRLERSRQWAVRCLHEASLYDKNCFLTLTYSDKFLPPNSSLCLRDFQLFMKRLRRGCDRRVRFFHCGEYGDENGRPHYHALLFNYDFEDKRLFSTKGGYRLYTSDRLSELWPKGHGVVGEVSFESAGYVARYALKKVTGKEAGEFYGDMRPEYCTMSRRPGIGAGWYSMFRGDVYPRDGVVVNGVVCRPPRFYDGLLGKDDPALLAFLKLKRESDGGKRFVFDVLNGKEIVESDSSDRRLCEKEKTKLGELSLLSRHKESGL